MRAVVVTGMGSVTPLGAGVSALWEGLVAGRSGLARNTEVDMGSLRGGAVWGPVPDDVRARLRATAPGAPWANLMLRTALEEGLQDAALEKGQVDVALLVTTQSTGNLFVGGNRQSFTDAQGHARALFGGGRSPSAAEAFAHFVAAGPPTGVQAFSPWPAWLGDRLGCATSPLTVEATCATGVRAIAEGARAIALGQVDVAVVGLLSARMTPYFIGSYNQMGALSRHVGAPQDACRPFDARRDGMVVGEAAACLVLEAQDFAARRGAPRVHGRVLGWAFSSDGAHPTAPEYAQVERTLALALQRAQVPPDRVDLVSAHGTSTRLNDSLEAKALRAVLGAHLDAVGLTANKSALGHSSIAAGAVESIAGLMALRHGVVPPVASSTQLDPACFVPLRTEAYTRRVDVVMKNAFGFGAQYGCLLLGRADGG